MFETERLVVRRLSADDVDAMHAVYGDAQAMRWVGDGQPLDRSQCVEWVGVTLSNYERRGYGMSALVLRETGQVIGFCGLVHPGGQPQAEIKYAFERAFWGRGFASEAVPAMLAYGGRELGLGQVIATVALDNAASRRVLLKSGMHEVRLRQNDDGSFTRILAWQPGSDPAA